MGNRNYIVIIQEHCKSSLDKVRKLVYEIRSKVKYELSFMVSLGSSKL